MTACERIRLIRDYRALLQRAWPHRHGLTARVQIEVAIARLRELRSS